jgi:hypothetical protein
LAHTAGIQVSRHLQGRSDIHLGAVELVFVLRPMLWDSCWRVCLADTAGIQVSRHLRGEK